MKQPFITALFFILFAMTGITTACSSESESKLEVKSTESNSDVSFLKEGMQYVEARKLLIEHGWRPFSFEVNEKENILPSCLQRFSGCTVNDKDEYCLKRIETCKNYPEIDTSSSDGYVMMIMGDNENKQLFITIFANGETINPAKMHVTGWRFDQWVNLFSK